MIRTAIDDMNSAEKSSSVWCGHEAVRVAYTCVRGAGVDRAYSYRVCMQHALCIISTGMQQQQCMINRYYSRKAGEKRCMPCNKETEEKQQKLRSPYDRVKPSAYVGARSCCATCKQQHGVRGNNNEQRASQKCILSLATQTRCSSRNRWLSIETATRPKYYTYNKGQQKKIHIGAHIKYNYDEEEPHTTRTTIPPAVLQSRVNLK